MFDQLRLPTLHPYAQGYFAPLLLQLYYDTLLTSVPKSKVCQRDIPLTTEIICNNAILLLYKVTNLKYSLSLGK